MPERANAVATLREDVGRKYGGWTIREALGRGGHQLIARKVFDGETQVTIYAEEPEQLGRRIRRVEYAMS